MNFICTCVAAVAGNLSAGHLAELEGRLPVSGAPHWLSKHRAAELPLDGLPEIEAIRRLHEFLDPEGIDVLFSSAAAPRRKKLLVADMDSTIVTDETLDELADQAGIKDEIAAITVRAMAGDLDFEEALRARVRMLAGLPAAALEKTWTAFSFSPGARELVATMHAHGATCVLVTGGFSFFSERVAAALGFHHHHANVFEIGADGKLTGEVVPPILGRDSKYKYLLAHLAAFGGRLSDALCVGDGANDLPMIEAAQAKGGLGVACHPHPPLEKAVRSQIRSGDLRALLYAQGYSDEEIVTGEDPR